MLDLDGSAAGGQFLRTSLALAALTDTSVRIDAVRGDRPDPGLNHQHLATLEAFAAICAADVEGDELDAESVVFEPGPIEERAIEVAVGTAGSVPLVFDALMPLATSSDVSLSVTATGGTDVTWSPPLAYLSHVTLPLLRQQGLAAAVERERTGFYPAGGGRATLHLGPSTLSPFDLTARGSLEGADIVSLASADLRENDVAERQVAATRERLAETGITPRHERTMYAETESSGTTVLVALQYARTRAGFSALGERGRPAESVGRAAAERAISSHDGGDACVDRHLADQLLVYLALVGGAIRVPAVTDHVESSLQLLERFGARMDVDERHDAVQISAETTICG